MIEWLVDILAWGVDVKRDLVCVYTHSPRWKFLAWEEDCKRRVCYWCKRCNKYR